MNPPHGLRELPNPLGETILAGRAPSGLRVLIHPRPDYERTFAALATNFGSVDRVAGLSGAPVPEGLAHFLEHKLFEDREGDVSDRFATLGASTNAMTGFCTTTYIASTVGDPLPSLELLLRFVQDPWFTDELVAKEQGIIAQEIRMYDDDPDWRVFFGLLQSLYANHPVRDNIAGSVESIAEIDAATLQRCYGLFYHPSNLCLAVSGGVEVERLMECVLADQAARGVDALPAHRRLPVEEPRGVVRERYEERLPVSRTRWLLGIKELDPGGDGETVLRRELTTHILLDIIFGRSSSGFESLYEEGLIDESWGVGHSAEESFAFSTLGGDTDDPEALEARVRAEFGRARDGALDTQALTRVRRKLLGGMLRALDSPEHVAYGLIGGAFRGLTPFAALQLVESIGPEDLRRRLDEHVRDEAMAVSMVRPLDGP